MTLILLPLFFLFLFGLAVGSFLNVIIYRMVHNDSPLRGRSYCDNCKKQIKWYDNIPVISFFMLRRQCRYCHTPIAWEYPAVELLTGTLFVWWYVIGSTFFRLTAKPFLIVQPLFWLVIGIILVVIFFADLMYYIIPDSTVFFMSVLAFGYRLFLTSQGIMTQQDFVLSIVCAIGAGLFFLVLYLLTRGKGMGFGDVKLAVPLGMLLGWPNTLVGIFVAFILGAIVGVGLLIGGKKKLKSHVPFGPFLVLGTLIALLWGDKLVMMYLTLL